MSTHRTTGWHLLRAAANTANLSTPVGVAIAVVGRARLRRGPRGLLLAENYRLPFPPAGAFTLEYRSLRQGLSVAAGRLLSRGR